MTARRVLAAVLMCWLSGCGPQDERAIAVTLANLVDTPSTYHERLIVTEGVVHTFADPRHYWLENKWLENEQLNRVALQPDHYAEAHVGQQVRATGRYMADHQGRRIVLTTPLETLTDNAEP